MTIYLAAQMLIQWCMSFTGKMVVANIYAGVVHDHYLLDEKLRCSTFSVNPMSVEAMHHILLYTNCCSANSETTLPDLTVDTRILADSNCLFFSSHN